MSNHSDVLPEVLRELRRRSKLSQAVLGREVGVDHNHISHWEKGLKPVPLGRVARLCTALKTTPDILEGNVPLPDPPKLIRTRMKRLPWLEEERQASKKRLTDDPLRAARLGRRSPTVIGRRVQM